MRLQMVADSMENKYKLIIAYDGTDYCGWQAQKEKLAVAQVLSDTFKRVFKQDVSVLGASRTDAGVHSLGQTVRIRTPLALDAPTLKRVWNSVLPNDVVIRKLDVVTDDFHPFYNVQQKTYWYHFSLERCLPHVYRYAWYFRYAIDMHKLEQALQVFVGTHDFAAFATDSGDKDTVKTINSISLRYIKHWKVYRIEVKGASFLHFMIRRIVGACLAAASRDRLTIEKLRQVLESTHHEHSLPKAAARGLCLYKIQYKGTQACTPPHDQR